MFGLTFLHHNCENWDRREYLFRKLTFCSTNMDYKMLGSTIFYHAEEKLQQVFQTKCLLKYLKGPCFFNFWNTSFWTSKFRNLLRNLSADLFSLFHSQSSQREVNVKLSSSVIFATLSSSSWSMPTWIHAVLEHKYCTKTNFTRQWNTAEAALSQPADCRRGTDRQGWAQLPPERTRAQ